MLCLCQNGYPFWNWQNALQDLNTMLTGSTHHMSLPTIYTTIEALIDETLQLSLENEPVSELSPLPTSLTDLDKSLAAGAFL